MCRSAPDTLKIAAVRFLMNGFTVFWKVPIWLDTMDEDASTTCTSGWQQPAARV